MHTPLQSRKYIPRECLAAAAIALVLRLLAPRPLVLTQPIFSEKRINWNIRPLAFYCVDLRKKLSQAPAPAGVLLPRLGAI